MIERENDLVRVAHSLPSCEVHLSSSVHGDFPLLRVLVHEKCCIVAEQQLRDHLRLLVFSTATYTATMTWWVRLAKCERHFGGITQADLCRDQGRPSRGKRHEVALSCANCDDHFGGITQANLCRDHGK